MRKKSYLDTEIESIQGYSKKSSYIVDDDRDSLKKYNLLPEEYDMFSELDQSLFAQKGTRQVEFISTCLLYMKKCLIDFYNMNGVICILPKLICTKDDDDTVTFSMALSSFRAFISFEGERGNNDAYYGVLSQTEENSVSSETKKLTTENYEVAIRSFLQVIINNS